MENLAISFPTQVGWSGGTSLPGGCHPLTLIRLGGVYCIGFCSVIDAQSSNAKDKELWPPWGSPLTLIRLGGV